MMLPTHVLVGLLIASPLFFLAPESATIAIIGALVGSVLPDLDMYRNHRRTLHYPTGYTIAAILSILVVSLNPQPLLVGVLFVFIGAAIHCRMDRYGGGLELRPWEATSDRAVFDHVSGRWHSPKRWIRYDGAPEDVILTVLLGIPLFILIQHPIRWLAAGMILLGLIYGLLRRRLANMAPNVAETMPDSLEAHIPERYQS